jgi:hypothetical protein
MMQRGDESPMAKLRASAWTAKQVLREKLGKEEDKHLVASDSELDSKVAVCFFE